MVGYLAERASEDSTGDSEASTVYKGTVLLIIAPS
jgi:hypothetical protein